MLIQLNFHKNPEVEHHCPVLFKDFTKNSHIVAIATIEYVFSIEAMTTLQY